MKKLWYFIMLSTMLFGSLSCSQEESLGVVYEIKTSGVLTFNEGELKTKSAGRSLGENDYEIEYSFISDNPLPKFETMEEVEDYYNEFGDAISGTFVLSINGDIVSSSAYSNGKSLNSGRLISSSRVQGCNFDDISKCTQNRIDNSNWLEKAFCIVEGFECVARNFLFCSVDEC